MKEIYLKHVKVVVGWGELIKHKYTRYLGSFERGYVSVFEGKRTIYLFSEVLLDDYRLSETGLSVEQYYSSPDYTNKKYRVKVKADLYLKDQVDMLHQMKILTDEIYQQITEQEAERKLAYFNRKKEEVLKTLKYIESEIKKYESNT